MQAAWRLAPLGLLRGRLVYGVQTATGESFEVSFGAERVEINGLELRLPAAVLGGAWPRLEPLGLSGEVRVSAPRLALDYRAGSPRAEGALTAQWLDAGSSISPLSPFGAYALALRADPARVTARITTLQGPLEMAGQGEWQNGAAPALQASLRVPDDRRAQFEPFLRMFAVETGPGSFELRLQ
jgi:general secretion pathway protein N